MDIYGKLSHGRESYSMVLKDGEDMGIN